MCNPQAFAVSSTYANSFISDGNDFRGRALNGHRMPGSKIFVNDASIEKQARPKDFAQDARLGVRTSYTAGYLIRTMSRNVEVSLGGFEQGSVMCFASLER